jgi:RHS repeat-associated protein
VPDHAALAGQVLEDQQLGVVGGQADQPVESKRNDYEQRVTVRGADLRPQFTFDATWVGLKSTTTRVYSSATQYRERRSVTTYSTAQPAHSRAFQPSSTLEEGWVDVQGDERCSVTEFAEDAARWMFVYPAVNKLVAGGCTSTDVVSTSQTYYDGSTTLKALPGRGNPTMQRTLIEDGRWSTTRTEFDDLGRPVKVFDPNGIATTTVYSVAAGGWAGDIPTKTTTTNPLGHVAETEIYPEFGVPKREKDPNGNLTEYSYDSVGRLVAVWLPDAPIAFAEPSWRYAYDIPNRAVRTRMLTSQARTGDTVTFDDTWVIHDGFLRPRQTQTISPTTTNALVAETTYDNRGLVQDQTAEQVQPGAPGVYRPGTNGWANRTRTVHDELGRAVRAEWWRGQAVAHATTTEYGLDTVTVTGPDGRKVREQLDGLGRKVKVEESDDQDGWVSSGYTYDLADRLSTITDPAGNVTSYTTNKAGWRTGQDDPNRGTASFTYDDAGQRLSVTDALGQAVHSRYDAIGRQVELRKDSPTGQLLAAWQYDTAPGGVGAPHKEISYDATGAWTAEVLGYDHKGRATGGRLTVPAGLPGLSGTYTATQTYNRSDQTTAVTLPALGGLPAETVTTTYNSLGMPTRLSGLEPYVQSVTYDDRGRRTFANLGPTVYPGRAMKGKLWYYDADQRMNQVETYLRTTDPDVTSNLVYRWEAKFDAAGNLVERDVPAYDGKSWRECYVYDARHRLTNAFSTTRSLTCADADQPAERGTGDQPFQRTYAYHPDGRLHVRSDVINPDWEDLDVYEYPAAGADRPHAPTQVKDLYAASGDTYAWDANGNLAERTVDGATETFAWDALRRLSSVSGPSGTTSFVYAASGERLLRRAGGRSTLYWAGHEVTVAADGSVVKSTRPYSLDGELIAVRATTGVAYVDTDGSGSVEQAAASSSPRPTTTRLYDPYGDGRHQAGAELASDRGFVGQIEDSSTNLSYLGARYYDTSIGIFISTDPLYDTANVKSLNPYQYGFNNPTTFADPAGTMSNYTYGLEKENAALKASNKSLRDIIKQQGAAIAELQDVIREQQRHINELYTYISSLEAIIREQQAYIAKLEARVRHLERQVAYWKGQAMYWRRQAYYWRGQAMYWQGRAMYYAGIVDQLGGRLWGEEYFSRGIAASIHSGRGIPEGAFAFDRISGLQAQNATLLADIRAVTDGGMVRQEAWDWIHENRAAGATETQLAGGIGLAMFTSIQMEANETARYGQERFDAGYDLGYDAGQDSSSGWSCAVSVAGTGVSAVGIFVGGPITWAGVGVGLAGVGLGGVSIWQSC